VWGGAGRTLVRKWKKTAGYGGGLTWEGLEKTGERNKRNVVVSCPRICRGYWEVEEKANASKVKESEWKVRGDKQAPIRRRPNVFDPEAEKTRISKQWLKRGGHHQIPCQ